MKPMLTKVKRHINIQNVAAYPLYDRIAHCILEPYCFLVLLQGIASAQVVSSTSIVIAYSDSFTVIGADRYISPDDSTVSWTVNKIIVVDDSIIFVHSGLLWDSLA